MRNTTFFLKAALCFMLAMTLSCTAAYAQSEKPAAAKKTSAPKTSAETPAKAPVKKASSAAKSAEPADKSVAETPFPVTDAMTAEARRLEKLIAPWITDTTVGLFHVDTRKLKLRETYDEIYQTAKKQLPRTLAQPDLAPLFAQAEAVLNLTEAEFAKLEKAGGRDVFVLVDMSLMTQTPVLVVMPVDTAKKAEVKAVMNLLKDAPWLPAEAKEVLLPQVAVELVGDCVVCAATMELFQPTGEETEGIPKNFLKKIHENMTPAKRPLLTEGLAMTADSAVKGVFLSNQPLELLFATMMKAMKDSMPPELLPVPLPPTKTLVEGVQLAAVELDVRTGFFGVHLLSKDAQSAEKLYALQKRYAKFFLDDYAKKEEPPKAMQLIMADLVDVYFEFLAPRRDGRHIYWTTKILEENAATLPEIKTTAIYSTLLALLLPAVNQAREAARRLQSMNNTHQLAMAMLHHEAMHAKFPPAYTMDKKGKPLHSWRVLILPYMEENLLYEDIRLDEPWDSEWNRQFHDKMPRVYADSRVPQKPGMTTYAVVVGENTMFPPGGKGISMTQCTDGTSNTVMIVERTPVCWMDPAGDVKYEEAIKGFNVSPNGLVARNGQMSGAMCDGSVRRISITVDPEVLELLLQRNDKEILPADWDE